MKKYVKYISRIILALFTIFWGLVTYCAFTPMDEYPCEAGQKEMSPYWGVIITIVFLFLFCFVWYKSKDSGKYNQRMISEVEINNKICERFLKAIEDGTLDIIDARECLDTVPYYTHISCSEEVNSLIEKLWKYCKQKGYIDKNVDLKTFATKGMAYFRLDKYESSCRLEREKKFELRYNEQMKGASCLKLRND